MAGENLEKFTFPYLINSALSLVPDDLEKTEGSVIYDALAPACFQLSQFYLQLRQMYLDTYINTATGEYVDMRAAEYGITREQETFALRKGEFKKEDGSSFPVSIGSRFSTKDTEIQVNYTVLEPFKVNNTIIEGAYILKAEKAGTIGNKYIGEIMPISYISGLSSAYLTTIIQSGQDIETDEELKQRYMVAVNNKSFGGNVAQYDEEVKAIDGVGEVQIYPVWNGGGTVKVSVIDSEYNQLTDEFINVIQNMIDPKNSIGENGTGLGLAPIGHKVTVTTPTKLDIFVTATINFMPEYNISQIKENIEKYIEEYFFSLREQWGIADQYNNYSLTIFNSRVTYAILSVPGVTNATNVLLNNNQNDIVLQQNATTQELPFFAGVELIEN